MTYEDADAQRRKVLAELGEFGFDLRPVGQSSLVSLLYIMKGSYADLDTHARDALEAAAVGLKFLKSEYTFLSLADLRAQLERIESAMTLEEAVRVYIEVLDPNALIVLEAECLEICPLPIERTPTSAIVDRAASRPSVLYGRPISVVTDFFTSYSDPEFKKLAWAQMIPVARGALY